MKQPLRTLKLKAWRIMSDYVRQRDKGVCYTCGDRRDWKKQEAGHFFHRKKYPASYFDPRNIHAQCVRCNHFLSGNLAVYAKRLIEQYGAGIIEECTKREISKRLEESSTKISLKNTNRSRLGPPSVFTVRTDSVSVAGPRSD